MKQGQPKTSPEWQWNGTKVELLNKPAPADTPPSGTDGIPVSADVVPINKGKPVS